jgi:type IV secretion system protein VirB4
VQPYTLEGPYGHVFDGNETTINDSRWVLFEMGELMEYKEKVVAPAIMFIFRWLEKKFNGQMTLLIIDEAWRFLDHEVFRRRMRQWLKELRKKHVFCVFATQEVADGAKSEIASTLIQNCPTKIYLADPEAFNNQEAYETFGLSVDEINMLTLARKKKDYYYKSTAGTRLFDLVLGPVALGLMRQPDNIIRLSNGELMRWGKFQDYLLHKRDKDGMKGYVEEILDIQGIKYEEYLNEIVVGDVKYVDEQEKIGA